MQNKTTIYDYDDDFAHYELDTTARKKLGQVWTPYSIIERMMDKIDKKLWKDETRTNLDPTMGSGNIVISMLYRRIVEYGQNPLIALSNVYGVELDRKTLNYARKRIEKFMAHFTKSKKVHEIVLHNFVCSDIFKWNILDWRPKTPEEIERDEKEKKEKKKKLEQEEKEKKRKLEQENNLTRFGLSKKSEEEIMAELGLVY